MRAAPRVSVCPTCGREHSFASWLGKKAAKLAMLNRHCLKCGKWVKPLWR